MTIKTIYIWKTLYFWNHVTVELYSNSVKMWVYLQDSLSQICHTHPEHTGFRSLVTGFLRYESDRVVESVLEHARTEACACRDAARNYHTGVEIWRMLEEFTVAGPDGPRQESMIHR